MRNRPDIVTGEVQKKEVNKLYKLRLGSKYFAGSTRSIDWLFQVSWQLLTQEFNVINVSENFCDLVLSFFAIIDWFLFLVQEGQFV